MEVDAKIAEPACAFMVIGENNDVEDVTKRVGIPAVEALVAADGGSVTIAEMNRLLVLRPSLQSLGGLASQRDALEQAIFLSAMRWAKHTNDPSAMRIARALSMERLAARPASPQAWFWQAQVAGLLGDLSGAHNAKTRAVDLGLGQGGQF